MERKPPSHVLGIPAVLFKAERAVVPHENVNAMVADEIVKGCYDSSGRLQGKAQPRTAKQPGKGQQT